MSECKKKKQTNGKVKKGKNKASENVEQKDRKEKKSAS